MIRERFLRWAYRGGRPNRVAAFMNRFWATVGARGVAPDFIVRLEVRGRRSGEMRSLPVVPAIVDGRRFLVSMLGEHVSWVANVRAAGGRAVLRHGRREEVRLREVPVGDRAPIIKAYVQRAPGGRPHVPVRPDAPLAEFEAIAAGIPVFEVQGVDRGEGAGPGETDASR